MTVFGGREVTAFRAAKDFVTPLGHRIVKPITKGTGDKLADNGERTKAANMPPQRNNPAWRRMGGAAFNE